MAVAPKKSFPRRVDTRDIRKDQTQPVKEYFQDVMRILADPHPQNGADYAIHLWYRAHGHNPRFTVTDKVFNDEDRETVRLMVDNKLWSVNIRTGKIEKIGN